jgi:hypothetical protein
MPTTDTNFSEQSNPITSIRQNIFNCDDKYVNLQLYHKAYVCTFKIVSTSCYLVIYYILLNDAFSISDCTVENDRIIKK